MHILVNTTDNRPYKKPGHVSTAHYDTAKGAKTACTKLNKKGLGPFMATTSEQHRIDHPVKLVTRINLQSGRPFQEAEDTPNFCSPASEAYWSM